jgi:hypothetical protein
MWESQKQASRTVDWQEGVDSEEQKETFKDDPTELDRYSRDVEGELNKRFTLVCFESTPSCVQWKSLPLNLDASA